MSERRQQILSLQEALHEAFTSQEARRELALAKLWRNWDALVGPETARLLRPLGHRENTMLLGAENSVVMQEFSFFGPQILEKANAFLGTQYFKKVQLELLHGRQPLDVKLLQHPEKPIPDCPFPLGNLLPCMAEESPVTACYRAYVRFFRQQKADQKGTAAYSKTHSTEPSD